MEIEAPIQIGFPLWLDIHKKLTDPHEKDVFFKEVIASHTCFQERSDSKFAGKWNHGNRKQSYSQNVANSSLPRKERTKIGNQDVSKENLFKKELISVLNKLTNANLDTIIRKTRVCFQVELMELFVQILWEYFKRQPDFQPLYVKLLESIYQLLSDDDIIEMNLLWSNIWNTYTQQEEWKIDYKLIEQSYNYDDFCEYVKEKKKLNAVAQAWSRLLSLGMIRAEPYEWLNQIVMHCYELDLTNVVHKSMIDSYIEQIRDYCKVLPSSLYENLPSPFIGKMEGLKELELLKSSQFKVMDFVEALEKMKTIRN